MVEYYRIALDYKYQYSIILNLRQNYTRFICSSDYACNIGNYEGILRRKERQRALSFWSIGSWGGSGLASLFGGMVSTFIGWRWIFILSIIIALISML